MKSIKFPTINLPNSLGIVVVGAVTGVVAGAAALVTYSMLTGKSSGIALVAKNALALQNTSGVSGGTSFPASKLLNLLLPASAGVIGGGATGLSAARKQVQQVSEKFNQQADELRQQLQTVETNLQGVKKAQSTTSLREELEQIRGIGPKFSTLLQTVGINNINDLAQQETEQLRSLFKQSGIVNRLKLDDWILQAQYIVQQRNT